MHLFTRATLTWETLWSLAVGLSFVRWSLPNTVKYSYECLRCVKNVDYLLIAKPVCQLTTWESTMTVRFAKRCRLLVVLYEDRQLCFIFGDWQGDVCLNYVRSRYKVFWLVASVGAKYVRGTLYESKTRSSIHLMKTPYCETIVFTDVWVTVVCCLWSERMTSDNIGK